MCWNVGTDALTSPYSNPALQQESVFQSAWFSLRERILVQNSSLNLYTGKLCSLMLLSMNLVAALLFRAFFTL